MRSLGRLLALLLLCLLALQASFALRIAAMAWVAPQSTSFQRSEAARLLREHGRILWAQQWVPYEQISPHLKRAVIASEDAGFSEHSGVEWDALEKAWERNERAEALAQRSQERLAAEAFLLWRGVMPDTAPVLQRLRRQLDAER